MRWQAPPYMTEDMLRDREAALQALSTSAVASSSTTTITTSAEQDMLLSDMCAFKAANPGACLADFVRWHSPRDWLVEPGIASPPPSASVRVQRPPVGTICRAATALERPAEECA
jgi:hypothetical protein